MTQVIIKAFILSEISQIQKITYDSTDMKIQKRSNYSDRKISCCKRRW